MEIFGEEEAARAKGLISTIIDGYEGSDVGETIDFLMTDVEDWEALSMELAGHAACVLIVLAKVIGQEPYKLLQHYINSR